MHYTLTRLLGASFADWFGVPAPYGDGLQPGTGPMSLATRVVPVTVLGVMVRTYRMTRRHAGPDSGM
ncbi:hypothetical protein ACGF3G_10095 [Streptomyces sp. NPDC048179]|uniref:hypothetical protein n=1 Tax=Streptomyces sp. NPDC048179 TaxID=3365506 RepID=UPI00372365F9